MRRKVSQKDVPLVFLHGFIFPTTFNENILFQMPPSLILVILHHICKAWIEDTMATLGPK
jgi:hypothetical protein